MNDLLQINKLIIYYITISLVKTADPPSSASTVTTRPQDSTATGGVSSCVAVGVYSRLPGQNQN